MKLQLLFFLCRIFFRNSRNFGACFGGRQAICAKLRRKKCFNKINISASETLEAITQKQIQKLHCFRPMSRDNGGRINPTLWCSSSCCNNSPNDLLSRGNASGKKYKNTPEFQLLIFVKLYKN